ncbi:hypothetical protein [Pseudobutyrivibrio sp. MD2005]|uniref:hypothetical protein n=1 Tax=Pseudobutyrivibrio sp. MD2005 TaxID=1410616 RepID=UPI000484A216|nr:hypothetical protein [Pseudobutyrivibrio sp. MD2005]
MEKYYIDREQEQVNKTLSGERAKLSRMTFSQKISYIFTYYKMHIVIFLIIVGALVWIVHHRLNYVEYKLYGTVINSDQVDTSLEKTMPKLLGMGKHEGFSLIAGLSGDVDANSSSFYNQIDIYTVSGQMDFVFTDEVGVQYLCDMGTPLDVTEELPDNLMEIWTNREAEFSQRKENDDTYFDNYAAVDISGTKVHDYFGLDDNTTYLVIVDLSNNEQYMQNFYQLLYDIEMGE